MVKKVRIISLGKEASMWSKRAFINPNMIWLYVTISVTKENKTLATLSSNTLKKSVSVGSNKSEWRENVY